MSNTHISLIYVQQIQPKGHIMKLKYVSYKDVYCFHEVQTFCSSVHLNCREYEKYKKTKKLHKLYS